MTEAFAERLAQDIGTRALAAFDELGQEIHAALEESVSVPVGFAGSRVIRSLPGEPPCRETGGYRETLSVETERRGDSVSTSVFTDSPLGVWLEKGTRSIRPRPHFEPIFNRYAALAAEAIGRRMFQN